MNSASPRVFPGSGSKQMRLTPGVADGHDPSWLYDVPFETLRGHRVYCFGDRRLDLATRLDYGQVDFVVVDNDDEVPTSKETISLLANYTAFNDWLARSDA